MADILIVKHGEHGDAQGLSEEIMKKWPDARVQVANPNEAHIFLRKEKWDLLIVDPSGNIQKALNHTKKLPGTMQVVDGIPVVMIGKNPINGGCEFKKMDDTTRTFFAPWMWTKPRYAIEQVGIALNPRYREQRLSQ